MKQTLFKQNGGTYTHQGDYLLPNVKLPDQPEYEIGVWGNRRRQYLKQPPSQVLQYAHPVYPLSASCRCRTVSTTDV